MFLPNDFNLTGKKRACTNCHGAKQRCDFIEYRGRCHRCIDRGLLCIPHVSKQGQRPNKNGSKTKAKDEAASVEEESNKEPTANYLAEEEKLESRGHAVSLGSLQGPGPLIAPAVLPHNIIGNGQHEQQGLYLGYAPNAMQQSQPLFFSQPYHQNLLQGYREIPRQATAAVQLQNVTNSYAPGGIPAFESAPADYGQSGNPFTQNIGSAFVSSVNQSYNEDGRQHQTVNYAMASTSSSLPTLMSFKTWIKSALGAVRVSDGSPLIASSAYLMASLKIAISLTRQFANDGDTVPMSTANDWAAQTIVNLVQKREARNPSFCDEPPTFARKTEEVSSPAFEDEIGEDECKEMVAFFKCFDADEFEKDGPEKQSSQPAGAIGPIFEDEFGKDEYKVMKEVFKRCDDGETEQDESTKQSTWSAEAKRDGSGDINRPRTEGFFEAKHESVGAIHSCFDGRAMSTSYEKLAHSGVLDVDSAEILCSKRGPASIESSRVINQDKRQIYYLGLVFYELFSGGEVPPSSLYSLASCANAFISLSTLTLLEQNGQEQTETNESKRCKGPSKSETHLGLCKVSCEYLRLRGVPSPVCSLINDMLNCVYGESEVKECYTDLADITSDLQLMMNEPKKFLRGWKTNELSLMALPMHEFVVPREEEMEIIKSCYHRSVADSYELAIVKGDSGSGKSYLAQSVGSFIVSDGGMFLSGKFCQMRQDVPFSALTSAFNQYCDVLMQIKETSWSKSVVRGLKNVLGRDAHHLIRVIPKLGVLLDHKMPSEDFLFAHNSPNASERLHYLLCRFVEVITTASDVRIALHMDDLQWADESSLAVLNRLLRQKHNNFFFIGCYRDDDLSSGEHPLLKMLENFRTVDINITIVKLHGIKVDTINETISRMLCLLPRLVRPLSAIIHNKTRGNILFVSQLLLSMYRDGLLYIDRNHQRWMWDERDIVSQNLPDNVAECFANGIYKQPLDVQVALHTLSMIGTSVNAEYIQVLESQLGLNLDEPLKRSATEGLTNKRNGFHHFCHDRIQEASYNMIGNPVRQNSHMMYGRCLAQHSLETNDQDLLFVAVNQINLAGPTSVSSSSDCFTMAKHNMDAGRRSMAMSDFSSAYSYFSNGISFLNENHWRDQYDFSIQIHELASKSALATGNIQRISILAEQIFNNAVTFVDTLNAHFIVISSLLSSSKIQVAMEECIAILSRLGDDIPTNLSPDALKEKTQQALNLLTSILPNIMNYKTMTDVKKLMTMEFLSLLIKTSHHAKPALLPFLVIKMMELTVIHGLSPRAPGALAFFGSYLARLGDIQLGSRVALLAKSLVNKLDANEISGQVLFLVADIQCYTQPLLAVNELRTQGEQLALSVGDVEYGCFHRLHRVMALFWAGVDLQTVNEKISQTGKFLREQEHIVSLAYLLTTQRTALILMGSDTMPSTIEEVAAINTGVSSRHKMQFYFQKMHLSLLMSDGDLRDHCEKFFENDNVSFVLLFIDSLRSFVAGVACFRVYRDTRDPLWLQRGKQKCRYIKGWVEKGSTCNFENKLMLLQAEESYSCGNIEDAKAMYNAAISSAQRHGFVNEEALADELAARFYFETGDAGTSLQLFRAAHEKYQQWGAFGKATHLFADINRRFRNVLMNGANQKNGHGNGPRQTQLILK